MNDFESPPTTVLDEIEETLTDVTIGGEFRFAHAVWDLQITEEAESFYLNLNEAISDAIKHIV